MPDDLHTLPDTELMRRAQAEDSEAFSVLVERYQQPLLRVARSRTRRADWADELVQETLMAAYRGRRTFDRRFSFRTWLWTILLNHCKAHAARRCRQPRVELLADASDGAEHPAAKTDTPFAALWRKERAALLDELLARLTPAQADALRLRFFADLKFQEIADTMGCSLLTAKNRVRSGLLRLAELAPRELAPRELVEHRQHQISKNDNTASHDAEPQI